MQFCAAITVQARSSAERNYKMIHPTAIISPEAKIGKNVEIGPYAVIESDVVIGDNCFIDCMTKICRFTTIGDNTRIYKNAIVGDDPQDHRMVPNTESYTQIGANVVIREYVTVHRSPTPGGITRVGDGCMLMAFVHIAHDVKLENNVTIANHSILSGHIEVGRNVVISGHVMIHQFCRVGELAMVTPGSKIRQDVPPYVLLSDDGKVAGLNVVGLRRAGMSAAERSGLKKTLKTFFFKGLSFGNAAKEMENADFSNQYTDKFCEFMTSSKRGVISADPAVLAAASRDEEEED